MPYATSIVLANFLKNFMPTFFGVDKDFSETNAIKSVFPNAKIQLCLWHAKRAIKKKVGSAFKSDSRKSYHPAEAAALVPGLEICWGSSPERRPSEHRFGRCSCPSREKTSQDSSPDRVEVTNVVDKDDIPHMFTRHFNAHPLIPDRRGVHHNRHAIHVNCAKEMYDLCKMNGWANVWYTNWYNPVDWKLWARSVNEEIPVLKTTMIVKSHWRTIKHGLPSQVQPSRPRFRCLGLH